MEGKLVLLHTCINWQTTINRFEELVSFAVTLITAWVLSALLVDGYKTSATAGEAYVSLLVLKTSML